MPQINTKQFYNSGIWLRKRNKIWERDNFECQKCKQRGGYSAAECVHHIKHLKDRPDLALTDSNLISLCFDCHNIEHPEKLKKNNSSARKFINQERW